MPQDAPQFVHIQWNETGIHRSLPPNVNPLAKSLPPDDFDIL